MQDLGANRLTTDPTYTAARNGANLFLDMC